VIKLATLLREIGENTAEAYTARKVEIKEDRTKYSFETDSGLTYRVVIAKTIQDLDSEGNLNNEVAYDVSFGVVNFVDKEDYDAEVNDPKNLFRVMATVINVTKEEITEDEREEEEEETGEPIKQAKKVMSIYITPSKTKKDKNTGEITYDPSDYRRYKLYRALIEKNAPLGSTVEEVGSQLVINLPEERPLKWRRAETPAN
jgi:hypothetical protein